jgi:hypothetical protein
LGGGYFVLAARSLDHCPLVVSYGEQRVADENFKFEASWLVNDACYIVVKNAWEKKVSLKGIYYIFSKANSNNVSAI